MIVEQAPGMHLHAMARYGCGKAVVEDLPVVVTAEHGLTANAAVHDVLPCAFMVLARGSRHGLAASGVGASQRN